MINSNINELFYDDEFNEVGVAPFTDDENEYKLLDEDEIINNAVKRIMEIISR